LREVGLPDEKISELDKEEDTLRRSEKAFRVMNDYLKSTQSKSTNEETEKALNEYREKINNYTKEMSESKKVHKKELEDLRSSFDNGGRCFVTNRKALSIRVPVALPKPAMGLSTAILKA